MGVLVWLQSQKKSSANEKTLKIDLMFYAVLKMSPFIDVINIWLIK